MQPSFASVINISYFLVSHSSVVASTGYQRKLIGSKHSEFLFPNMPVSLTEETIIFQYFSFFAEPPRFVKIPSDSTTSVNKTMMFHCKASSDLGIKYFWFQRVRASSSLTSILKLDKRFNIFPNGSLEIRRVQKKDEAYYHCRAENPIGQNNASAFLRVLGNAL